MRPNELRPLNRTGTALAPALADALAEAAEEIPVTPGSAIAISRVRARMAHVVEPVGSMPPPARARRISREQMILLDKLGERLAFERAGVRLYDALLSKLDAHGSWQGGPTRADLVDIRADEHTHFLMLREIIQTLGGDPTAVTPSANLAGVMSSGLPKVLTDPRTDLQEGLEAILVAELADNDCWATLCDLALAIGHEDLAQRFEDAYADERDHLRRVRSWLGAAVSVAAVGELAEPFEVRAALREKAEAESLVSGYDRDDGGRGRQPRADE